MTLWCVGLDLGSASAEVALSCGHAVQGIVLSVRSGAEYFLSPDAAQRRYEALRAYFVRRDAGGGGGRPVRLLHRLGAPDGHPAAPGRMELFADTTPGPKGPRKATGEVRDQVLALRAAEHSISRDRRRAGRRGHAGFGADGVGRSSARGPAPAAAARRGPPRQPDPAGPGQGRPAAAPGPPTRRWPCDHAGLLLLFPAMAELGLPELVAAAGYPDHPGDLGLAVDRHPAAGQVRPPAPASTTSTR